MPRLHQLILAKSYPAKLPSCRLGAGSRPHPRRSFTLCVHVTSQHKNRPPGKMRLLFGSAPAVRTACFTAPLTGGKISPPVLRLWTSASHYSIASGNGRSACWSSSRQFQNNIEETVAPAVWVRRYSIRREVGQEDKRETKEELERLEMKDKKPAQNDAPSEKEEGSIKGAGHHYKIEDVMTKGKMGVGRNRTMMRNLAENAITGKLLTTPSRLFKLLIPLPTAHHNSKHMGKCLPN